MESILELHGSWLSGHLLLRSAPYLGRLRGSCFTSVVTVDVPLEDC